MIRNNSNNILRGKSVALMGSLGCMTLAQATSAAEDSGARVVSKATVETPVDYLVRGDGLSALQSAEIKHLSAMVPKMSILSAGQFLAYVSPKGEEKKNPQEEESREPRLVAGEEEDAPTAGGGGGGGEHDERESKKAPVTIEDGPPPGFTLLKLPELNYNTGVTACHFGFHARGRIVGLSVKKDRSSEENPALGVPLCRTTLIMDSAMTYYSDFLDSLSTSLSKQLGVPELNNVMTEVYSDEYATMRDHSDQTLDLEPGSSIVVCSAYSRPNAEEADRVLIVTEKATGKVNRIKLLDGCAICFDLATNHRYKHRIEMEGPGRNNSWLGLTFRRSSTFAPIVDGALHLNGQPLVVANDKEQKAFYQLKAKENSSTDYVNPSTIHYTLSPGDLLPPKEPMESSSRCGALGEEPLPDFTLDLLIYTTMAKQRYPEMIRDFPGETLLWEKEEKIINAVVAGAGACDDAAEGAKTQKSLRPKPNDKIYACGQLSQFLDHLSPECKEALVLIQDMVVVTTEEEKSSFGELQKKYPTVHSSSMARKMGEVGVMLPRCFEQDNAWFEKISTEHEFQELTESTKDGVAHRTGIYITPVEETKNGSREFNLLRCSSNFKGPTAGSKKTDVEIFKRANDAADRYMGTHSPVNHALAQIYWNHVPEKGEGGKPTKASIRAHSDKTKDMPRDAVMGFATFYQGYDGGFSSIPSIKRGGKDPNDFIVSGRKGEGKSVLTKLVFRPKPGSPSTLTKTEVTLYPNSLFVMSITSNRLYTHEIVPSSLEHKHLPTRMGYVIRCSKTKACHTDGQTFIKGNGGDLLPMTTMSPDDMSLLRALYAKENSTVGLVDYPLFLSSMNRGDYEAPLLP